MIPGAERIAALVTLVALSALLAGCSVRSGPEPERSAAPCGDARLAIADGTAQLRWRDEFDGPAGAPPDASRWQTVTGGGGWGSFQQQTYRGGADNLALSGTGQLWLTARTTTGETTPLITSARVMSRAPVHYGYLAARIKMPSGPGLWPAFWTQGEGIRDQLRWPHAGEIDIVETADDARLLSGAIHAPLVRDGVVARVGRADSRSHKTVVPDAVSDYHVYAVAWSARGLSWYVDGRRFGTVCASDVPERAWQAFTTGHLLILNLAVGGTYPQVSRPQLPAPRTLAVDWVRVYDRVPAEI